MNPIKEIYICSTCGSGNVRRNVDAAWNVLAQQWEIAELFDSTTCEECGCERRLQRVELQDPDVTTEGIEVEELLNVVRFVLDNWEHGDLAAAVQRLQAVYHKVCQGGVYS